jgi:hypothetical protein
MAAYLRTVSGKLVDVTNIKPEDINAYDIAWALHHANRYAGHTPVAWDVLSHTGLVYMLYVKDLKGQTDINYSKAIMLHDAAEAYIGDMIGHLKNCPVGDLFRELEQQILRTIFKRFGMNIDDIDWLIIDRYDHQAAHVEIKHFFPELTNNPNVTQAQYHMEWKPTLIKAKVADYIEFIKNLSINSGVVDVSALFEITESIEPLLDEERRETSPVPQTTKGDVAGQTINSDIEGLTV